MRDRAGSSRREGEFGRAGFDQRDKLGDRPCRHRWMDDDDDVVRGRKRYRLEVLEGIVWHLAEEDGIDGETADVEQDGVAIRRRLCHLSGADAAARTSNVLDIELLSELLAQLLNDQSCENIRRAARSKRYDDAHRPCRIGLRPGDARFGRQSSSARNDSQKFAAGKLDA